jgi:hypothetical protein
MLSAADTPSETAASIPDSAISTTDAHINVDLLPYGQVLRVTGSGQLNVTIDLSQLPDGVVNLQISSFSSVTLVGSHSVDSLLLQEIKDVDAGHISIGRALTAFNVDHIKIDTAPTLIWLQGSRSSDGLFTFGFGSKTLLEANHFADQSTIYAGVENLGISTTSGVHVLNIAGFDMPMQSVLLNFQSEHPLGRQGLSAEQISVVKGDFSRYFLASPSERASLEQSLIVARRAAITVPVAIPNVLATVAAQGVLGTGTEGTLILANFHSRVSGAVDLGAVLASGGQSLTGETSGEANAPAGHAAAAPEQLGIIGNSSAIHFDSSASSARSSAPTHETAEIPAFDLSNNSNGTVVRSENKLIAVATAAASELGGSFVQLALGFHGQVATFGELATASVAENLQTEARPALLANPESARQRDDRAYTIVVV